jgi:hypothetical protein
MVPAVVLTAETLTQRLYPPGGGHFEISLSTCQDKAAVLNGHLANHTGDTWLYAEVELKLTQGSTTTKYVLNLERIGADGRAIRQRIDGPAGQDCGTIRLSDVRLISAYSEERMAKAKR